MRSYAEMMSPWNIPDVAPLGHERRGPSMCECAKETIHLGTHPLIYDGPLHDRPDDNFDGPSEPLPPWQSAMAVHVCLAERGAVGSHGSLLCSAPLSATYSAPPPPPQPCTCKTCNYNSVPLHLTSGENKRNVFTTHNSFFFPLLSHFFLRASCPPRPRYATLSGTAPASKQ